jgi:hypothetical protein
MLLFSAGCRAKDALDGEVEFSSHQFFETVVHAAETLGEIPPSAARVLVELAHQLAAGSRQDPSPNDAFRKDATRQSSERLCRRADVQEQIGELIMLVPYLGHRDIRELNGEQRRGIGSHAIGAILGSNPKPICQLVPCATHSN